MKLGVTSLIFEIIIKNKVFAATLDPNSIQVLGGDVAVIEEIQITSYINRGITLGTIIMFAISILGFYLTKIKLNKDKENKKAKKLKNVFKILSITSVFVFVIWQIIYTFL